MIHIQKQEWHDYTRFLLFADEGGSVAVELYPTEQNWGSRAWLYGLYVDPENRRKGLGKLLLYHAEEVARIEGHKAISLEWAEKDTPEAILQWYLRNGYDEKQFSGNGDYYLLEKKL